MDSIALIRAPRSRAPSPLAMEKYDHAKSQNIRCIVRLRCRFWKRRARAGTDVSVTSAYHDCAVPRRRSHRYDRAHRRRGHAGFARATRDYRKRERGLRQHRDRPRRARRTGRLYVRHRIFGHPCLQRRRLPASVRSIEKISNRFRCWSAIRCRSLQGKTCPRKICGN